MIWRDVVRQTSVSFQSTVAFIEVWSLFASFTFILVTIRLIYIYSGSFFLSIYSEGLGTPKQEEVKSEAQLGVRTRRVTFHKWTSSCRAYLLRLKQCPMLVQETSTAEDVACRLQAG